MSAANRFLKWILIIVAGAVALIAVALISVFVWITYNPESAWKFVQSKYLPADLKVNWHKAGLSIRRVSGLNFALELQIYELQIDKESPLIHTKIDEIDFAFQIHVFSQPHLEINNFTLIATDPISIALENAAPRTEPSNPFDQLHSNIQLIQKYAHQVAIDQININVADVQLSSAPNPKPIRASVIFKKSESKSITLNVEMKDVSDAVTLIRINADLLLDAIGTIDGFAKARIETLGPGLSTDSPIVLSYYDEVFRAQSLTKIRYRLKKSTLAAQPDIVLRISPKKAELEIKTRIEGIPGPVVSLKDVALTMTLPFSQKETVFGDSANFYLQAPVALFFVDKNMRRPIERSCQCRLPETLLTTLEGELWPKNIFEPRKGKYPALDARFAVQSLSNKLFSADIGGQIKLSKQDGAWLVDPSLDSEVTLHSFQGLRQFLDSKNILIPAPINVLDGTLTVTARTPVKLHFEKEALNEIQLAAQIEVDLKSKTQSVKLKTNIDLSAPRRFSQVSIDVKTYIQQLRLELPPLDPFRGIPNVTRDNRIRLHPQKPPTESNFKVFVSYSIETSQPSAIQLLSSYASPFVPITVHLQQKANSDLLGAIKVEPFQIHYLRRTLFVESFKLSLVEDANNSLPMDGSVRIEQTDYVVTIHVGGTIDSPVLKFESQPYLDRNDIISVLLYDRVSDQLASSDAETAGGVQAAIADRAIGLLGLWAFATTPIKSFSYNPATKVYTATVAVGGGLTAGVGTDWENGTRLELRKRISKRWVLAASWVPSDETGNAGQIVLQWEKRF